MTTQPLDGRRIAVPETRELDLFAELLTRRGAEVVRCPLVSILDAPDPGPVLAWIEAFIAGSCEHLILLTGEGLRRLLGCIDRHAPSKRAAFVARLAAVRKITRGPKPARALREIGLKPDLAAIEPTTAGIIESLRDEELRGRRIGVQLYGSDPNLPLMEFLAAAGATALPVAPYVYASAAADEEVRGLIDELARGALDAIAFTSMAQVDRLYGVAAQAGLDAQLRDGMRRTLVAAVGPVVAQALRERGARVDLMPAESYFLKPLTQALCSHFSAMS